MKFIPIANTDLEVSELCYGCMRLTGGWSPEEPGSDQIAHASRLLHTAVEGGINFFDHADIYAAGQSERTFGKWLKEPGVNRDKLVIQSKVGIRFKDHDDPNSTRRLDSRKDYILRSAEGCLKRLGIDHLDLLLIHRPDALMEPAEVAAAFEQLKAEGKVRHFGVSNFNWHQIEWLKTALSMPLVANQLQLSLLHSDLIDAGMVANRKNHAPIQGEGTLEYCQRHLMNIQPWCPMDHGVLNGKPLDDETPEHIVETAKAVKEVAEELETSTDAVLLGWLMRHPACMTPIVGTTNLDRLKSSIDASDVAAKMTHKQWYRLYMTAHEDHGP